MTQIRVGRNLPGKTELITLDKELAQIEQEGFDVCEINLGLFPMIISGGIKEKVVAFVKNALEQYELSYSAHIGYGLNLRDLDEVEMNRSVLRASIEVCAKLGIRILTIHYDEKSTCEKKEEVFTREILEAADFGRQLGVVLSIENIETDPVINTLEFVKKANHPNLRMTLDLGHLFLSAGYFQYDFLQSVRECAPHLAHMHINDNTGIFEPMRIENHLLYDVMSMKERYTFGRGDIHIPPLWGKAPLKDAFTVLKQAGYEGTWLCEYYSHLFVPFNKEVQENVRRTISGA